MALVVEVVQGSLTDGDERVLVNASNTNGRLGSGVSAAIRRACGPGFQERIEAALDERFSGPMPPGEVLVTDAHEHPRARWVVHVAVMDYRGGGDPFPDEARIRTGCEKLWPAVEGIEDPEPLSVAMVALGAGTGGLGVRLPTELACETLKAHLARTPDSKMARVRFYGWLDPEYREMSDVIARHFPDGCAG